MDGTLIHELTHAFIFDRTRGSATREVHEGLAQYMEGKRSASDYSPQVLAALADGRIGGVNGFYLAALSYVEHLIATRGMGGMNDLLRAWARPATWTKRSSGSTAAATTTRERSGPSTSASSTAADG